jgi:ribose-phosphate pyrophosphokinase
LLSDLRILTGNAHPALAQAICDHLKIRLSEATVRQFSNENIWVQLKESIRSKDVYIVQPFSSPVNQNIMELLIMLDTCKRSSAGQITAVIPYYAYGRTDKKDQPRVPITARLIADLITVAGANRVVTLDLHAQQIQGFFNIPMDELRALPLLARYFKRKHLNLNDVCIVSPDIGAAKRARDLAVMLGIPSQFAIINKRRDPVTSKVTALNVIGDVCGKRAILVDEEINTGSSVLAAARSLAAAQATDIYICCTHAVFSGEVLENLTGFPFKEIVVTDTLPLPEEKRLDNIRFVSVAPLLGDVIKCINEGKSLGQMLGER